VTPPAQAVHPKSVVLDVSLRDGGYLNDWQFSESQRRRAIEAAGRFGADIIELGYIEDDARLPVARSWTARQIESVMDLKGQSAFAAMCRPSVSGAHEVIRSRREHLDLVRIPVDVRDPTPANALADRCVAKGLPFSFNLTGISLYSPGQLREAARALSTEAAVLYLADSRSALNPTGVVDLVEAVREVGSAPIGFHAHDSLGLALANTHAARSAGCTYIDGSLFGVGLGGRNLDLLDALALAGDGAPTCEESRTYGSLTPFELGIPEGGPEQRIFRAAAMRNLKMEWVVTLLRDLGLQESHALIQSIPWGFWLNHEELEPFAEPKLWGRIQW
jgi:4-hydroxy 2-oxovalerate aldolase